MKIDALDHVALAVRDVERSAQWYVEVLGFRRQYDDVWNGVPLFVANDAAGIALFPIRDEQASASFGRGGTRILHFAFRTDRKGFLDAQEELKRRGIEFEFQDHEISHSIYFRDPDDHEIEITTYEL